MVNFMQPNISIAASIKPITAEEFNRIKQNDNPPYDDIKNYRNIIIKVQFVQPFYIIHDRNIEIDNLQQALSKNKGLEVLDGGSIMNDAKSQTQAIYEQKSEILLSRISEQELREYLGEMKIKISWFKGKQGKEHIYYIKDYLK